MIKICTKCKIQKPEEDYRWKNKSKGKRTTWCKECFSSYEKTDWRERKERRETSGVARKARRDRNRQFVWDYLSSHPCMKCPESDPVVLEFDHRDPSEKVEDIAILVTSGMSIETILKEIDKCDVLCANCHRRKTAVQFGWYVRLKTTARNINW